MSLSIPHMILVAPWIPSTPITNSTWRKVLWTACELAQAAGFEVLSRNDKPIPPAYSIHEVGTCRMGDDPKKSVLNEFSQSHDHKNLFVVDGAVHERWVAESHHDDPRTLDASLGAFSRRDVAAESLRSKLNRGAEKRSPE
jgi:hypothetical protein